MSDKLLTAWKTLRYKRNPARDDRLWIFSSTDNRAYNYNSKYLFEYVVEHLPQIDAKYVMNDPRRAAALKSRFGEERVISTATDAGVQTALRAGVWFTSAGLPVYGTGLCKDRIVVNLWHGVPLKKIALADPALGGFGRLYFKKIFSENYTHILTTSDALREVMARSFRVAPSVVKVWGQPRNDPLFRPFDRDARFRSLYGTLPEYRHAVLYAPTFRENRPVRLFPFDDLDADALCRFLEAEKLLLFVRSHIREQAGGALPESPRIRLLNEDKADDVTELLGGFDLLMTDYSSVYIDFLLTGNPILFLPYDYDEYLRGRGLNFEYDAVTPGPKPATFADFCAAVRELLSDKDRYRERRAAANRFFNQIQEPVSERICREILKELEEKHR